MMDLFFMEKAYEVAKKGQGTTSPNPLVGTVIVYQGKIVASAYHKKASAPHAEVNAIKIIKKKYGTKYLSILKNSELYVTLEPCVHHGKTPPCVDMIISTGIKAVYVGTKDPFKKVNGKGAAKLRKNGIKVSFLDKSSDLYLKIRLLNQPFFKSVKTKIPYITLKSAVTLDGKIALSDGSSKWISSIKSRQNAYNERYNSDAVLVGYNTIINDNPNFNDGSNKSNKQLKIILDKYLSLTPDFNIFKNNNVLIVTTSKVNQNNLDNFQLHFPNTVRIMSFGKNDFNFKSLFNELYKMNIQSVFVEGGGKTSGKIFDLYLHDHLYLDRVVLYIAPKLFGSNSAINVISGDGITKISKCPEFLYSEYSEIKPDIKFSGLYNIY